MSGRASPNARLSRDLKERLRRLEGFMRVRQFTLSCSPRPSSRDLLLVIVACLESELLRPPSTRSSSQNYPSTHSRE